MSTIDSLCNNIKNAQIGQTIQRQAPKPPEPPSPSLVIITKNHDITTADTQLPTLLFYIFFGGQGREGEGEEGGGQKERKKQQKRTINCVLVPQKPTMMFNGFPYPSMTQFFIQFSNLVNQVNDTSSVCFNPYFPKDG